jgi:hypothetical protein
MFDRSSFERSQPEAPAANHPERTMGINHPDAKRTSNGNLTAHAARVFDRMKISGSEPISSTERQLVEACVRAIAGPPEPSSLNASEVHPEAAKKQTQSDPNEPCVLTASPIQHLESENVEPRSPVGVEFAATVG